MASIVLISATSRSSGIQAFEANHLVSSYLWFSPLPFRWQQFECEKLEFPGIYKSIIKLANHPSLLQPNLPLSASHFKNSESASQKSGTELPIPCQVCGDRKQSSIKEDDSRPHDRFIEQSICWMQLRNLEFPENCPKWWYYYMLQVVKLHKTGMDRSWLVQVLNPWGFLEFYRWFLNKKWWNRLWDIMMENWKTGIDRSCQELLNQFGFLEFYSWFLDLITLVWIKNLLGNQRGERRNKNCLQKVPKMSSSQDIIRCP